MIIRYFAKRSLIAGHTLGIEYDLQIGTSRKDWKGQNIGINGSAVRESVTLSGASSMTVARFQETYSLTTVAFLGGSAEHAALLEALDSIRAGEEFQIDIDRAGDFILAKAPKAYSRKRLATIRHYQYSLEVRLL